MITINVSQARQQFLELVNRAYAGEEFIIVKNKIPVAKISAVTPKKGKKKIKRKIPPGVFGMWKDRWPEGTSSVDIVNKWRDVIWKGRYDR